MRVILMTFMIVMMHHARSYDRNQGKEKEQRNVNVGGSSWMVYMVSEVNAVSR
jgi:hypothetical protein